MTQQERLAVLEHKVGINKDGTLTGNGIVKATENNEEKIEELSDKLENIRIMQAELNMRFDMLESDLKDLSKSISFIEDNLKDNITLKTITKWKNVVIGIAGVVTAFGTIGYFLYKLLYLIYEKGK